MPIRKFQYSHPSSVFEAATYNYNGRKVDVPSAILCPDCRTPTVWVEDDMTVSRIYHDPTCMHVRTGQGEASPFTRRKSGTQLPPEGVIGYEEHERRRREQGYA